MSDNDDTFKLTRRRALGGLAAAGAASAAAGAGTMALFSDTESSSGNTVQAGTLDLEVGSTESLDIDVSGKPPGWSGQYSANVDNAGSVAGGLRVEVNVTGTSDGATPDSETNYAQSNELLDEVWIRLGFGGYDVIDTATSLGTAEMLGELDALQRLSGGSGTSLDVEVGIDRDATNEVQGDEITFEVSVSLLQGEPITVGSGTGTDYSTIQAAVDAASAGDSVKLVDSSYSESFTISNDGVGLYGKGATIDAGNAKPGVGVDANDVTVHGLEVTNADQAVVVNTDATGSTPRKSGVTLMDLTVDSGAGDRAVVVDYSDNVVANDITSSNNGNDGFTFWYTHDSRAENLTADNNGDNGIYFNGDNNALLHSQANGNTDEGVDLNWVDLGRSKQRVLVDGVTARNNGQDDVELHDNGSNEGTAADGKLLKNVDTSSSSAPTSLRLVQVSPGEVETVNCVFPTILDGTDNDVDP